VAAAWRSNFTLGRPKEPRAKRCDGRPGRCSAAGTVSDQVVESYTSGDLVVLVAVERQHGEAGGLPDQD
jgi:hypothetical protein